MPALPLALSLFAPIHNRALLVLAIVASLLFSVVLLVLAHFFLRTRQRRTLIIIVTFLGGLFFTLEYFWPTHEVKGQQVNFLTDWIEPAVLAIRAPRMNP